MWFSCQIVFFNTQALVDYKRKNIVLLLPAELNLRQVGHQLTFIVFFTIIVPINQQYGDKHHDRTFKELPRPPKIHEIPWLTLHKSNNIFIKINNCMKLGLQLKRKATINNFFVKLEWYQLISQNIKFNAILCTVAFKVFFYFYPNCNK